LFQLLKGIEDMPSFYAAKVVLSAALATSGTFTVNYPTGKDRGAYENGNSSFMRAMGGEFRQPSGITISWGATAATITYKGTTTIPAGTEVYVQLEEVGDDPGGRFGFSGGVKCRINRAKEVPLQLLELGAPAALVTNGICASQNRTGAGALLVNGSLASGGVATLDVPRNVIADSGGADTAVITVTGKDEYGRTVTENITLNGTTAVPGKKAFKTITSVSSDATITNGFFLGTGDVLGLPIALPAATFIQAELADGAAAVAGTVAAALAPNTVSTATTADVRGTYDPNSACDGAISFALLVALPDPNYLGNDQFAA